MSITSPLSTSEHATILRMLSDSQRLDGRSLSEYRQLVVRFPPPGALTSVPGGGPGMGQGGCCMCRLGGTSVLAEVWCEVGEPHSRRPSEGQLHVNLDLGALTSAGVNTEDSARLQPMLKQCLRDCVDLEALCIVTGERVFLVRVEARVLAHDGNLLDCAALACLAALATFRRPDVVVDEGGQVVIHHDYTTRDPVPLTLRHMPVVMSLGLAAGGKIIVVDPLLREEAVLDGCLRVSMNTHRQISFLHTSGGMPVQEEHITRCLAMAERNVRGLYNLVQRALEGAEKHRSERSRPVFLTSTSLMPPPAPAANQKGKRGGGVAGGKSLSDGELSTDDEAVQLVESDMELASDNDEGIPTAASGPCNPYSMQEMSTPTWGDLIPGLGLPPPPPPAPLAPPAEGGNRRGSRKRKGKGGRGGRQRGGDEEEEGSAVVTLT